MIQKFSVLSRAVEGVNSAWSVGTTLTRERQLSFAALVGIVSGVAAFYLIGRPDYTSDLAHFWFASRTLMSGTDPYTVPLGLGLNPGQDPALYPLTTYLIFAPFSLLPLAVAGGVFVGAGASLAAFGVARTGMHWSPMFLSAPFILTLSLGQWSPWLVAGALLPSMSWIAVAKPNIGLATWLARPGWRTGAAIAGIILVTLLIQPDWPGTWLAIVADRDEKFIPLFRPGGFVLLAAVVAWRRPEGRLLMAMSLIPQTLLFYDQLLLWLVPRTLRQSLVLSLYSVLAFAAWWRLLGPDEYYMRQALPWAQSQYFVALAILLWNHLRERTADADPGSRGP